MNKPFIFLFLSFASGIFFSEHIISGFIIITMLFIISIINFKNNKTIIFFILFFLLGFLYSIYKINYLPENHIKKLHYYTNGNFTIHITEMVEETEDKIYFNGNIISIENEKQKITNIHGKIRVTIAKNLGIKVRYGDIVKINGILHTHIQPKSKDDFNYKEFLKYKSIYNTLYAKEKDVAVVGNKTPNYFLKFSYEVKEKLTYIIYSSLPEEEAKVLEGIMLGNYKVLPEEINNYFKRTGTAHILAVSGMNVGIIALLIFLILKLLYFSRKISALITLIFISVFAAITGADPSIIRATFMAYVVLIGYIIEYDSDLSNSLAVAGFFILLINPFELFSVSFQLSFLATFGIIYYGGYISKNFPDYPKWLSEILFTTITSQIFIIPVMANTFHQVSIISVVANFFIVPVSSVITILGFVLWISGIISLKISVLLGASIWILIKLMIFIVKILSSIPFAAISVKSMNFIFLFLYYLFFIILPHNDIDIFIKKLSLKKAIAGIIVILFIFHLCIPEKNSYIYFPETKKIGTIFVKTQNNIKILLIGCDGTTQLKEISNKIILYLKKQGINILDYLILYSINNKQNYEIIKNNFYVRNILSDRYFDDKNVGFIANNSNFNIDKNINLSFYNNYLEMNLNNKIIIFSGYLNDELLNSKDTIIFSCCYDIKKLQTVKLQENTIIINSSIIKNYYRIKTPEKLWDINKDGEKMIYF